MERRFKLYNNRPSQRIDEMSATKNFENVHDHAVYKATDVDAAIAELKAMATTDNSAVIANIEDELRKTQRALWLARAERALAERRRYCAMAAFENIENDALRIKWWIIQHKCLKKAEEYK